MPDKTVLRTATAGAVVGGLAAGGVWLLDVSAVLTIATGVVWAAAVAASLYVFDRYGGPTDAGPWGTVVGGSLLFTVVLRLADVPVSNGTAAALSVLVIGFVLLGYAAGMATVSRQGGPGPKTDGTAADSQ